MVRTRKQSPTLDLLFFSSPEQKVIRFLLQECTTAFTLRVICSKLKGVRGLGGIEGMTAILVQLEEIGLVEFLDNRRSVRLREDHYAVPLLKTFVALSDLEGIKAQLEPLSTKGILFGSRANGKARSDSDYDLFVVTDQPDNVRHVAGSHPMGKLIEVVAWSQDEYDQISSKDPKLQEKIHAGIRLWGSDW